VDIVVKGRHTAVAERFRQHAAEKLGKVQRLNAKLIRIDVEVSREHNPRQSDHRDRVELTCVSRGPVIRAEAAAADPYAALDLAYQRLEARLRKAADRRRIHHGTRTPSSLATVPLVDSGAAGLNGSGAQPGADSNAAGAGAGAEPDGPDHEAGPFVVRAKVHSAAPMTIEQALFEMELVGHDFFLFADAATGQPSVVYRRRGYDYGVIRLAQ